MSGMPKPPPLSEPFFGMHGGALPQLAALLAPQTGRKNMTIQTTVFLPSEKNTGHEPI